jgi:Polyketide cyclase / dehydrase and lipid transport
MKTILRVLLGLVALVVLILAITYIDGLTLPQNHSTTVTSIIPAPPDQVFARITDIAHGNQWRPAVKAVTVLPPDNGRDHWVEDLGHNQTMNFLATRTDTPTRRDVLLDVPGAAYGGTWTYELSPGPTPNTTTLNITENGYINPPIYRFVMRHVIGMTYNLDTYEKDITKSFQ